MKTLILTVAITLAAAISNADEIYTLNGAEITKGEAIVALAKDPKAKVQRITDMKLNQEKGTLVKK